MRGLDLTILRRAAAEGSAFDAATAAELQAGGPRSARGEGPRWGVGDEQAREGGGSPVGIAGAGGERARAAATLPRREGITRRGQGSRGQGCPWARSRGGRGGGRGGFWNGAFHSRECAGAGAGARLRDAGTGRVSAARLAVGGRGGGAMVKVVDALLTPLRNSRDFMLKFVIFLL
jgi:hypothetical protein